jgi:hypothetical protein
MPLENIGPSILHGDLREFENKNNHKAKFPKYADYIDRKSIPFCPITKFNETVDWAKMLEEAMSLQDNFVPHRTHESHDGWESLCLHGLSSVHIGSNSTYGYENFGPHNKWTDVSFFTPTIRAFIESFNFPMMARIRIMKLRAGGFVKVHHDGHYGIGAMNIALNNPVNCNFYLDGFGILPFHTNEEPNNPRIILPNIGYYHSVVNHSNEDRYHMIVHAEKNKEWWDIEDESLG